MNIDLQLFKIIYELSEVTFIKLIGTLIVIKTKILFSGAISNQLYFTQIF